MLKTHSKPFCLCSLWVYLRNGYQPWDANSITVLDKYLIFLFHTGFSKEKVRLSISYLCKKNDSTGINSLDILPVVCEISLIAWHHHSFNIYEASSDKKIYAICLWTHLLVEKFDKVTASLQSPNIDATWKCYQMFPSILICVNKVSFNLR